MPMVAYAHFGLRSFLLGAIFLALIKAIRNYPLAARRLCDLALADYLLVLGFAGLELGVFAVLPAPGFVRPGLALVLIAVLWLDAVLFRQLAVDLSWESFRAYLPYLCRGDFKAEAAQLLSEAGRDSLWIVPVWGAALYLARELWAGSWIPAVLAAAFGVHVFLFLRGCVLDDRRQPMLLVALLVLDFSLAASPLARTAARAEALVACLLPAGLLALRARAARRPGAAPGLTAPSHFGSFARPSFPPLASDLPIRDEHKELLELGPRIPRRSPRFGQLAGANVLLLTLESVAREALALYRPGGARTPFLEHLWDRSVVSAHHFCISSHTNNAHRALFSGRYALDADFGLFRGFARSGYQTLYLYAGDSRSFDLRQLLETAGFDHLLDIEQLSGARQETATDRLLATRGVDEVLATRDANRPFFLQIMTGDTHWPYFIPDARPGARRGDEKSHYLRALEAADGVWRDLWDHLAAAGLLADTLVVITADHGESFGEMGYRCHSTAVIKEQIEVPFLLHHPRLDPCQIPFSSHLDVLPTVLDLLGIDHGVASCGESIFHPHRTPGLLLYSELRRNGVPSSQGLIFGDRKIIVDLPFHRLWELDWNDGLRRDLGDDPYYPSLIHLLLDRAGLVHHGSRSATIKR
ncbi:MAG TPA: sulfatase-like hydrolase/transferase [Thermoanaerobaculia bacterium]